MKMSDNPEMGSVQDRHLTDSQIIESRIESLLGEEPEEEIEQPGPEMEQESDEVESDELETESDEAEEEAPDPEENTEALEFESVDELAEALDLDQEAFLSKIKTKVKVDGEEFEVNLAELRDGYQRDSDYRKKTMDLSEQRKAFESDQTKYKEELEGRINQASALIDNLQNQILGEFQQINWDQLRQENPGEYAALATEFQSRQAQLNQASQAVQEEAQRAQKEAMEKHQSQMKEIVQKERQLFMDANPTWSDPEVAKREKQVLTDYLKSRGFTDQEIGAAYDHRILLLAQDAMKVGKVKDKTEVAKEKVKNLPKLVKPNAKKSQLSAKESLQNKLKAKIKKSGKTSDVEALILERMS